MPAKCFSLRCPVHFLRVACPAQSEGLPILMHGTGFQGIHHGELIHWGAGVSRVVIRSLRSTGARLNTSYFNTKEGCDVHTNEPIIGGFITQFLLSLIWQTYPLCFHHCSHFEVCAGLCVCVCVFSAGMLMPY